MLRSRRPAATHRRSSEGRRSIRGFFPTAIDSGTKGFAEASARGWTEGRDGSSKLGVALLVDGIKKMGLYAAVRVRWRLGEGGGGEVGRG